MNLITLLLELNIMRNKFNVNLQNKANFQYNLMSIVVQSQHTNQAQIIECNQLPSNLQDATILKQKMKQLQLQIQSLQKLKRQRDNSQLKFERSNQDKANSNKQPQSQNQVQYCSVSRFSQRIKNGKIGNLVSQLQFKNQSATKRKRCWSRAASPYTDRQSVINLKQTLEKIDISDSKKKKRVAAKIFELKGLNQQVQSNIYNVTIAEIMNGDHKTKQDDNNIMIQQIKELKNMLKQMTIQGQNQDKKTIKTKKSIQFNPNTMKFTLPQNNLTLPVQQNSAKKSNKLTLQQNTQRTLLNQNRKVNPFEQNTFRSQAVGTGKIYNKSRVPKQRDYRDEEIESNSTFDQGLQNTMQSIQLRGNTNPFTWNPQIILTLAQRPHAFKSNGIKSGRIYSSIEMQKNGQYSEDRIESSRKKPTFHIMKKRKIQSNKKNTQTIEVQTQQQQITNEKPKRQSKKTDQRFAQIKINRFKNNQHPPSEFLSDFRQYINERLIIATIPSTPTLHDAQSDLEQLGRIVLQLFDVFVDEENQKKGTQYKVTKYKNCVLFRLNEELNIVWYFDGKFYFGGWDINLTGEGKKEGFGIQIIPNSHIYQGMFKNSKRHGYGIISHSSQIDQQKNIIYDGFWNEGLKEGRGYQIQDELQYLGDFKQGLQTGLCQIKTQNTFYSGQIKQSVKQGKGHEKLKNGDEYKGDFDKNMFQGTGEYKWKSGAYFYGTFVEGKRKGEGIWISNINSEAFDVYKGFYEQNKKNGHGIYRWANGTIYQGYFKNDLRHDEGMMIFPNGKAAKFMWKDGNKANKLYSQQEQIYRRNRNSKNKMSIQAETQQYMEGNLNSNRSRMNFMQQVLDELNSMNLGLYRKLNLEKQNQ